MKKSIGIITYHNADNLGAVLQAYALQTVLNKKFNVNVQIIDYRCETIERTRYPAKSGRGIKTLIKRCLLTGYYRVKRTNFDKFRKIYLKLSTVYNKNNIFLCVNKYDAFITGSDQVWNLECSGWDYTYFLDFVTVKEKYSYAASIGTYLYTDIEQKKVANYLSSFQGISVREQSGVEKLRGLSLKNVNIHPDPVLLLSSEEWMRIMSKRLYKGKYLFIYLIQQDVNVRSEAEKYAKAHNLKIIDNKKTLKFVIHNSPADFLSWIYYADCVFTNSFHGTAYSLAFNKPLAADIQLINGRVNNRVKEMLESIGAEGCILQKDLKKVIRPDVDKNIERLQSQAFEYLKEICK